MAGYHRSPGPFPAGSAHRGGDLEVGVSGNACSPPARRWGSYAALAPLAPTRSGGGAMFFFDSAAEDEPRHFLDACFLCEKPLGRNRDIYMYRGDTPFCSEECRQEQIEMDEARENSWSLSMKASAARKEQQKTKDTAAAQGIQVRTAGAVVAV